MRRNGSASIKRGDLWLILIILLVAGAVFLITWSGRREGSRVIVTAEGKDYGSWPLSEDRTIPIVIQDYHNTLVIRDGEAFMQEADCPDKICVHHKPVSYGGESIICLPHKLVVTVEAGEGDGKESPVDAISK